MVWKMHTTYTSKLPPETVWSYMTNYQSDDHTAPYYRNENKGEPWKREVRWIDDAHVEITDTTKRWNGKIVVDLTAKPNKITTTGTTTMGGWNGETLVSRSAEGGTSWDFSLELAPKGFMKFMMMFIGGGMRKGFIAHGQQHFNDMEKEFGGGAS
jgi:hypothetical protein